MVGSEYYVPPGLGCDKILKYETVKTLPCMFLSISQIMFAFILAIQTGFVSSHIQVLLGISQLDLHALNRYII